MTTLESAVNILKCHTPDAAPLRFDWRQFAYTDGSLVQGNTQGPGIGAAVYVPSHSNDDEGELTPIDCAYYAEGGHDPACVNTINRAELAGLAVAISKGHLNIATDSMASIYQCQRMNTRPQDMREHRHASLITHINNLITQSTEPVHLWKVKSHIGIVGNERADEGAVAVAKGTAPTQSNDAEHKFHMASNDRQSHVLAIHSNNMKRGGKKPTQGALQTSYLPLANIAETLKSRSHNLHKLGQSNQNTMYFSSWQKVANTIDSKQSHAFMTSKLIRPAERKLAIQYRYGLLYTQKLAQRYKHCTSNKCILCGEADGGHHAVSGCKQLMAAVTKRHNGAGTEIVEAISKGTRAGELIMSDVGMRKRRTRNEIPG